MKRKSTMVEFVQELADIYDSSTSPAVRAGIAEMVAEAKAGEYHDYKNQKYACGKHVAYSRLRGLGCFALAQRIADGEFDEIADEDDKKMMRMEIHRDSKDSASAEKMCKMLGL